MIFHFTALFIIRSVIIPSIMSLLTKLIFLSWDCCSFFSSNTWWLANVTDSCCSADCHKQWWLSHFTACKWQLVQTATVFESCKTLPKNTIWDCRNSWRLVINCPLNHRLEKPQTKSAQKTKHLSSQSNIRRRKKVIC